MTIHRKQPNDNAPSTNVATAGGRSHLNPALAQALEARDFERAALLLLLSAIDAVNDGTIDDVIAVLAETEASDDASS